MGLIVTNIRNEAALLLRLITGDRAWKVTCSSLGLGLLCLIAVYGFTANQEGSPLAGKIAYKIDLGREGSMGEVVAYGLSFSACVLFLLASVENRSRVLLFASALLAFVWFDDSASFHENFGVYLSEQFVLPTFAGSRQRDTGELIAWLLAAAILGFLLLLALCRPRRGDMGVLALVSVGFGCLVFFGIFVDQLHSMAPSALYVPLVALEDGGEMLAIGCLTSLALGLVRHGKVYYDAFAGQRERTSSV